MVDKKRRSSTGKSKIIESSILMVNECIKNNTLEDIHSLVINNSLPGELRSVSWRIFLGILSLENHSKWAVITKNKRDSYKQASHSVINENLDKYLKNELSAEESVKVIDESVLKTVNALREELKKVTSDFDFFKSEIISELAVRTVLTWVLTHKEYNNYLGLVKLIAGLIYSLYPSILHIDVTSLGVDENNLENLDSKVLFYYLNSEEHFDADLYSIFDGIMEKGLKRLYVEGAEYKRVEAAGAQELLAISDPEDLYKATRKLNKVDTLLYFYLNLQDKDTLKKLLDKKVDLYPVLDNLLRNLFSICLSAEDLIYFWDCILLGETSPRGKALGEESQLHFAQFIALSYIVLSKDFLEHAEYEANFITIIRSLSPKEVIKRAIKLREKTSSLLN